MESATSPVAADSSYEDLLRRVLEHGEPKTDRTGTGTRSLFGTTLRYGDYGPGTPKEGWDHSTPWLHRILGDVLGLDLTTIHRKFTLVGVDPALDPFKDMAEEMRVQAVRAAETEGRKFARRGGRTAA